MASSYTEEKLPSSGLPSLGDLDRPFPAQVCRIKCVHQDGVGDAEGSCFGQFTNNIRDNMRLEMNGEKERGGGGQKAVLRRFNRSLKTMNREWSPFSNVFNDLFVNSSLHLYLSRLVSIVACNTTPEISRANVRFRGLR